ncbi:hypothetical protein [Seonamhaeicola aphaedonensis]|uniref:hypothetical protein n=1 Tax=Seonamhaeicola aphaedonensis TaxID=1461338 RepID=UPI0011C039A1|nr:hypothetical protein [Seonamhaeicola aphaedonensis]
MNKKEIYWLIGTIVLVLILNLIIFGIDGFKSESVTDINVHDTYFVIANYHFILLFGISIFFAVYLIRVLRQNFKNLMANLVLIISTILLSIIMGGISTIVDSFAQLFSGATIYPPLSTGEMEHKIENNENNFGLITSVIYIIQIVLLIFLAYCGFKTGLNYNKVER